LNSDFILFSYITQNKLDICTRFMSHFVRFEGFTSVRVAMRFFFVFRAL